MLKNYLLITLRSMLKQQGFTLINVSGLTVGIACSLLILLYLQDELQFDRTIRNHEQVYRVTFEGQLERKKVESALSAFPLKTELLKLSGVSDATRFVKWETFPIHYNGKAYTEKYLLLADPDFLNFFGFELVEGDPDQALLGERKVVITETTAKRYFNYDGEGPSPIGKTIELAQGFTAQISAIAKDPVRNTHFQFTAILSLDSWPVASTSDWTGLHSYTYLRSAPDAKINDLEDDVNLVLQQSITEVTEKNSTLKSAIAGNTYSYKLQPLLDIHLRSNLSDEIELNGSIDYIYLFSAIAAFIMLLACINFMNLTTAKSATRAKEIAVRKAVGAQQNGLIFQFLVESYLFVLIAVVLAFALIIVMLQPFGYLTGKQLSFVMFFDMPFVIGVALFVILTGLIAGSYPAFYLARYSPIDVLKGNLRARMKKFGIRNILVVFQFFVSSSLIISTMVVYHQLGHVQRTNVGFNPESIINLLHTRNLGTQGKEFKSALLKHDVILSASYCNRLPPNVDWKAEFHSMEGSNEVMMNVYEMDYDHLKTIGYELEEGRFFLREVPEDTSSVILNEEAARRLDLSDDYVGKKLRSSYEQPDGRVREVIGIVKDFNFQSLKEPIQPLAIVLGNEPNWEMAIRVKPETEAQAVAVLETLWKKYAPAAPFEYTFLKSNFSRKIETEKKIGWLFLLFTILAILIACLGLFGLATFTAEQQQKAIGIRKVLGATPPQLAQMLNKDFLILVLIANLLSWPVTWWLISKWLDQFAYHISPPWWMFLMAGMITALIAFFSVSFQALKAASGNPVDSLRSE